VEQNELYMVGPLQILENRAVKQPIAWILYLITEVFMTVVNYDYKISNVGHPFKPDAQAVPKSLPKQSAMVSKFYTWLNWLPTHCSKFCSQALDIWNQDFIQFPVWPKPDELAIFMKENSLILGRDSFTREEILLYSPMWARKSVNRSTAYQSYFNALTWLDAQLRKAAEQVPILHGKVVSIPILEIPKIKQELYKHYK
jgi:hypothetical protein